MRALRQPRDVGYRHRGVTLSPRLPVVANKCLKLHFNNYVSTRKGRLHQHCQSWKHVCSIRRLDGLAAVQGLCKQHKAHYLRRNIDNHFSRAPRLRNAILWARDMPRKPTRAAFGRLRIATKHKREVQLFSVSGRKWDRHQQANKQVVAATRLGIPAEKKRLRTVTPHRRRACSGIRQADVANDAINVPAATPTSP